MTSANGFPVFCPHPLFFGGHAQTLAGVYLPSGRFPYRAVRHAVTLPDGDRIVLHDDRPEDWRLGGRLALLIHGLAGCHQSGYMVRVAAKLNARGVRTFRMDLRGSGAGFGLARFPYHAGRSEDARAAIAYLAELCTASPVTLIGFSLGANIVLKLVGELAGEPCGHLDSAVAVCPPADLTACSSRIARPTNRLYDRHFTSLLVRRIELHRDQLPDAPTFNNGRKPRTLYELDDTFTAPICGFGTADNYYRQASSLPLLGDVETPTLIVAAADDPLVPSTQFDGVRLSPAVQLEIAPGGGHLGFISRRTKFADRRWMDWRIVDWVAQVSQAGSS